MSIGRAWPVRLVIAFSAVKRLFLVILARVKFIQTA